MQIKKYSNVIKRPIFVFLKTRNMLWTFVIVLIAIGLSLLILEVLVLPGGVAGILGIVAVFIGNYIAFTQIGNTEGIFSLIGTLILSVVVVYFGIRSKSWKNAQLKSEIGSKVNLVSADKIKIGDKGLTLGRLAPVGKARFNNEIFEVKSLVGFVDEEVEVEVIKIQGGQITVNTLEN